MRGSEVTAAQQLLCKNYAFLINKAPLPRYNSGEKSMLLSI